MSKIFLRLIIAILIIMLGVTVWDIYRNKSNGSSIEDKVAVEIEFLDENITDIINYLNNITINMYEVNKIESQAQEQGSGQNQSSGGQSSNGGAGGGQASGNGSSDGTGGGSSNGSSQDSGGSSSGQGQGQSQSQGNGQSNQSSNQGENVQYQIEKNSILNSERKVADWKQIKNDIEKLYTTFTTIELDLEESRVQNSNIIGFSELLDETVISIKQEDKEKSLQNLSNLYKYIPKFYEKNEEKKYVYETKSHIIEAYSLVEEQKWEQISNKISMAQEKFSKVIEKSSKNFTINKVNLLLKDLKEGIKLQDKDVFYIKYKNILDELGNLC